MKKRKSSKRPKQRIFRIGLVGCAGTGKSILAQALSEKLGVSLLSAKVITQDILDRDGFVFGTGAQIERFLAHGGRQTEILQKTISSHEARRAFVTDRTTVDLAAYAVCELHDHDHSVLTEIQRECHRFVRRYTHLFVCPWLPGPIRGNEKRTLNPWYQFMIHALQRGILDDWGVKYSVLETTGVKERVTEILKLLDL